MHSKPIIISALCISLSILPSGKTNAQIEIIGEIVKRVIMAIDLNVQRMQTKTIILQEVEKEVDNAMQQSRLADIASWVGQQKDLYASYYQELWQVKNILSTYDKVKDIVNKQVRLVTDYKQAYASITRDTHFTAQEITHICQTYNAILNQSIDNINQLALVIGSFITQMDDADRLHNIDAISTRIDQNYNDLQNFTQENILLSMQRAANLQDLNTIKLLYGIQ